MNNIQRELNESKSLIKCRPKPKWLSINEVTRIASISIYTIRKAVNRGEIIPSKKTGKWLFTMDQIDRWLND